MTSVTVNAGKTVTLNVNGNLRVYVAGDTLSVPTFESKRLIADSIVTAA